jgi:hypothetical protein
MPDKDQERGWGVRAGRKGRGVRKEREREREREREASGPYFRQEGAGKVLMEEEQGRHAY